MKLVHNDGACPWMAFEADDEDQHMIRTFPNQFKWVPDELAVRLETAWQVVQAISEEAEEYKA